MYTAYIGRRVLERYNARHGADHDPRSFFDEVFFPLFFDDERYLMWVNNSKFDQKSKQKKSGDPAERREALAAFHTDAAGLKKPHGHLLIGGTARELDSPTSGQVTDLAMPVSADDVYTSWVGAACGIGVAGGFSILLDHDDVLDALMDGWAFYRRWLDQNPTLKPQQIDTWNGWWLMHCFDPYFNPDDALADFQPDTKTGAGKWASQLNTPPWGRVLFALAHSIADVPLTSYVYSLGNTNATIGFIRLDLPQVAYLPQLYERLFGFPGGLNRSAIEKLWETEFGFRRACEQGFIGARALEPKALRKYMPDPRNPGRLPKKPKKESDEITFRIYQTWIIAMLNNEDLLAQAQRAAEALHDFSKQAKRGKQTHKTMVNEVLSAGGRRAFVEHLIPIVEEDGTHKELFNELVHSVVKMPAGNVPLFLALLRFKYAYVSA